MTAGPNCLAAAGARGRERTRHIRRRTRARAQCARELKRPLDLRRRGRRDRERSARARVDGLPAVDIECRREARLRVCAERVGAGGGTRTATREGKRELSVGRTETDAEEASRLDGGREATTVRTSGTACDCRAEARAERAAGVGDLTIASARGRER